VRAVVTSFAYGALSAHPGGAAGGDNNYPLSLFYAAGGTFDTSTAAEQQRDAIASEPYLSLTAAIADPGCGAATRYISYDDETSIIAKGTFSKNSGYGGIIVWTLEEGYLPANASGGRARSSLMQALKTGFIDP
jgi:chitinase